MILSASAILLGILLSSIIIIGIKTNIFRLSKGIAEVTEAIAQNRSLPETIVKIDSKDEFASLGEDLSKLVDHLSEDRSKKEAISKHLQKLATTDKLTGAFNRLKWDQVLDSEIEHVKRSKSALSLIMFDIDHFKSVNDKYGHDIGDIILVEVTRLVKEQIRKLDSLFRVGGEEFTILAPYTYSSEAINVADKIRQKIETHSFKKVDKLTISLGVTQFKLSEDNKKFVKRVDDALYQAKNSGRNCVKLL